jgi:hypothetical protein
MSQALYDLRLQQLDSMPEGQRPVALAALNLERIQNEMDDSKWAQWYGHYHRILYQPNDPDPASHVGRGLAFNLETTALYVLISAAVVPNLRRWWCILPSCLWVLLLVAQGICGRQASYGQVVNSH